MAVLIDHHAAGWVLLVLPMHSGSNIIVVQ